MKNVLHVSSECYPPAKAGGMGDVVGALPAYLPAHDVLASVVIPKYKRKWFEEKTFKTVHKGTFVIGGRTQQFKIQQLAKDVLAFPLYCIDLPGLFDRESIYLAEDGHGYKDEPERNIAFQTAVLEWLISDKITFDLVHVHDHMTGLIPFFMKYSERYKSLQETPSVLTIHNGAYRGEFIWDEVKQLLPDYGHEHAGVMDWDGQINSLATAIKCAWAITTVSPSYMKELAADSDTLTGLYASEKHKCVGILNGIDTDLWNPATDSYLQDRLEGDFTKFKSKNKSYLLKRFNLISRRPLIGFISRFAYQKGADILFEALEICLAKKMKFTAVVLGSGDKDLEETVRNLSAKYPRAVGSQIAYDEPLARHIYAGSDFLMMPSRFEPCGLNQLYAMRYGTIPVASHVGGLKDTVTDLSENGNGIVISELTVDSIVNAIDRALKTYTDKKTFNKTKNAISELNYSWDRSAKLYASLYTEVI